MRFAYATALLIVIASNAVARELVVAHWPMPDYLRFLADVSDSVRKSTGDQHGVRFPMLLVFSTSGELSWIGNPLDSKVDLSLKNVIDPAVDVSQVLSKLDNAWISFNHGTSSDAMAATPSLRVDRDAPTAVLVVFTLERGVCPPCDHVNDDLMAALPSDWNRLIAPVSGN